MQKCAHIIYLQKGSLHQHTAQWESTSFSFVGLYGHKQTDKQTTCKCARNHILAICICSSEPSRVLVRTHKNAKYTLRHLYQPAKTHCNKYWRSFLIIFRHRVPHEILYLWLHTPWFTVARFSSLYLLYSPSMSAQHRSSCVTQTPIC